MASGFFRLGYMLYFLDESIATAAEAHDSMVCERLGDLLYCWKKGLCIIDGKRCVIDRLIALGDKFQQFLLVKNSKQGIHNIYSELDFFVVLVKGDVIPVLKADLIDKANIIQISQFKALYNFAINFVVGENVRDFDLYYFGTLYSRPLLKSKTFNLNVMPFNGGGSTIVESVRHLEGYNRLIITDSDKKYASCKDGNTNQLVQNYIWDEHPVLCWHYTLFVHEAENLIPFSIIEKLSSKESVKIKKLKKILEDSFGNRFLQYFDFKNGFRESNLRLVRKYEYASLSDYKSLLTSICGISDVRVKRALNKKYDKKNDNELIPGFGNSILPASIEHIKSYEVEFKILDYQKNDWECITRKIWSLGCALKPKRT